MFRSSPSFPRSRRAFTLLEVTIAAAMLTTMMVATYRLFFQSRRLASLAQSAFDQDRASQIFLRRLERTIRTTLPYVSKEEDLDFHGTKDDLRFTTSGFSSSLTEIQGPVYLHLGVDPEGVFLEVFPVGFLQTESQRKDASKVIRLERVQSLEISYYDGKDWKDDWVLRKLLKLPMALKLRLEMTRKVPSGQTVEPVEIIIAFPTMRDVGLR